MTPAIIMDVVTVAILAAAVLRGCWRGLFLSLSGVAVLLLSLLGANIGAKALSAPVADWLTPYIETRIAETVEDTLREKSSAGGETLRDLLPESLKALLERTGLTEKLEESLKTQAEESITGTGKLIAQAVARALVDSFVYALLYILLLIALLLVLRLVVFGLNLVLKLPVLRSVNTWGGALLGLLEGALLVWLMLWLAPKFGVALPVEETRVLCFFSAVGPLALLSSLS